MRTGKGGPGVVPPKSDGKSDGKSENGDENGNDGKTCEKKI
jgi:hypothetical protein